MLRLLLITLFFTILFSSSLKAAPAYQNHTSQIETNADSMTLAVPAGTNPGDLLLAVIAIGDKENGQGSNGVIPPPEFTEVDLDTTQDQQTTLAIYARLASASEPASYDFDWARSAEAAGGLFRYSAVDAYNPVRVVALANGHSTEPTAPDVINPESDALVIRLFAAERRDARNLYITPPGTTSRGELVSGNGNKSVTLGLADVAPVAAGSVGDGTFFEAIPTQAEEWRAATLILEGSAPVIAPGENPLAEGDRNLALPVCSASGADGTATTSGVLNTYYPGLASAAAGDTSLLVGSRYGTGPDILAGDLLLIMQMQDADINSTDTTSYGDSTGASAGSLDIRQTGLYEFAIAASAVGGGGTLSLMRGLSHDYQDGSTRRFQVVRVPRYLDLTLNGTLTAAPWNGEAGGIVALDVQGTLDFANNAIDVSGLGFRPGRHGGLAATGESAVDPAWVGIDGPGNDLYAEKAEGIAGTPATSYGGPGYPNGDLARGGPGNAGGGGNDHNGGGGGGGNIGYGGRGGDSWSVGTNAGGRGGGLFNGYSGRLFMGGGGGAGHVNAGAVDGGAGAAGGGIIILNARFITAPGQVLANGAKPTGVPSNEAGGGGGAGGSVVIRTLSDTLTGVDLQANGGDGGDNNSASPHGPGGGGGGGAIYLNRVGQASVSGGSAGTYSGGTPPNNTHGALDGDIGEATAITDFPLPVSCDFPDDPLTYNGSILNLTAHLVSVIAGSSAPLSIGSLVDFEPASPPDTGSGALADADDLLLSTVTAGDDEEGVVFRYPTPDTLVADVLVNNPLAVGVTVCGWLDTNLDETYSAGEGICQDTSARTDTVSLSWSGLSGQQFTTYARFRITSGRMTTSHYRGFEFDGEIESHRVSFPEPADYGDAPVDSGFNYGDAAHGDGIYLQTLLLANVDSNWQTVSIDPAFQSPIVVCTYNLPDASDNEALVRLRDVQPGQFDLRLQRPRDATDVTSSNVHCLVAKEGNHTLPDGREFTALRVVSTQTSGQYVDNWDTSNTEDISSVTSTYTAPVFLGQVMTYNDANFSTFWSTECTDPDLPATAASACVGKQVGRENTVTTRLSETLGVIVAEEGFGSVPSPDVPGGVFYEVETGSRSILGVGNSPPYSYPLDAQAQTYSHGVVSITGMNGVQGGWPVLYGATPVTTQINLAIDEDLLISTTRSHTSENVAYWTFSAENALIASKPFLGAVKGDLEPGTQGPVALLSPPAADGDDANDTSGTGAGDDEDGVSFRSPVDTGQSIFADVIVSNPTGVAATVCAWLDVPGSGTAGQFDASDVGAPGCQPVAAGTDAATVTFQWSGLPADQGYVSYARFRISTDTLTAATPTGRASDGEVEDYRVAFDFRPTAVTIGQVALAAVPLDTFLADLAVYSMSRETLLQLLETWSPQQAADLQYASRSDIEQALRDFLDPDVDQRVAVLYWDTLEERGTIGFHIERRAAGLSWQRINENLLPGLISAPMGGTYQYADPGARRGTRYQYRLIELEARGTTRSYGPFEVEIQ